MNAIPSMKAHSTRNLSFAALVVATVAWCAVAGVGMTGSDRLPQGGVDAESGEDGLSKNSLTKQGATGADAF